MSRRERESRRDAAGIPKKQLKKPLHFQKKEMDKMLAAKSAMKTGNLITFLGIDLGWSMSGTTDERTNKRDIRSMDESIELRRSNSTITARISEASRCSLKPVFKKTTSFERF
jgi:hypothetical protein